MREDEEEKRQQQNEVQLRLMAENLRLKKQDKQTKNTSMFDKMAKYQVEHLDSMAQAKDKERQDREKERARRAQVSRPSIFDSPSNAPSNQLILGKRTKPPQENIALRLLEEHKQKRLRKQREREEAERNEYITRRALYEAGRTQTPPPPYAKSLYNIPEEMQEELEFSRLYNAVMTLSDPETIRRRNIYPKIDQDELEYATEFKALKNWSKSNFSRRNSEEAIEAISSDETSDRDIQWEGISFPGYYNDLSVEERHNRMARTGTKKVLKVQMSTREKVRAKTIVNSSTDYTDEDEPMRMRGGKGSKDSTPQSSPEGPMRTPTAPPIVPRERNTDRTRGERPPALLPGQQPTPARLAALQVNPEKYPAAPTAGNTPYHLAQLSPKLVPINTQDIDSDSEIDPCNRPQKRKKTMDSLQALNNVDPGMSQSDTLGHAQEIHRLGTKFWQLISTEKQNKKISVNSYKEFCDIKDQYQFIMNEMILENSVLLGRLEESRYALEKTTHDLETLTKAPNTEPPSRTTNKELEDIIRLHTPDTRRPAKERLGKLKKKKKTSQPIASTSRQPIASTSRQQPIDIHMETDFDPTSHSEADVDPTSHSEMDMDPSHSEAEPLWTQVVKNKRKTKKKKRVVINDQATSGDEARPRSNSRGRKEKLDKLKEIQPPKSFKITLGRNDASDVKKSLWSDVLKNTQSCPKISATRLTKKGDLIITPADEITYKAFAKISETRTDISKEDARWPHVMLSNVDSTLSPGELTDSIAMQNPGLGLSVDEAQSLIKPLYKSGPRDRETVNWVCMVSPKIFDTILLSRLYVGYTSCWAKEKFDYSQCLTCLKYGHRSANCPKTKVTCAHCGGEDHKSTVCARKDNPPTCINCKGAHSALSGLCKERHRAIELAVKRTDYSKDVQ